jgi:apolipoprotein N-acyltransferase
MPIGGALALTAIIAVASAGVVITQRRGAGWRRIVAIALLVWLAVAGVMVLWELIAAVSGQRAYFGAIQVPLATRNDAVVGSTLGAATRASERVCQAVAERRRVSRPEIDLIISDTEVLRQDAQPRDRRLSHARLPLRDVVGCDANGLCQL